MTLKKFVEYLNYIACVVAGMGIIGSILMLSTLYIGVSCLI